MSILNIPKETLQDPIKTAELINRLFDEVQRLSKASFDWPVHSTHGNITTRRKPKETSQQHHYFQRSSIHGADQVTYDQLRAILFVDHSRNEPKYIKDLTDAVLLQKVNAEADVFWLGFNTPKFSANREFVELVATRELQPRCFMVASQPVEGYHREDFNNMYVRGAYQAWEMVTEKVVEGKMVVEWVCIQHSSAGGSVPSFITDWVTGKNFYHDVDAIIKYIHES